MPALAMVLPRHVGLTPTSPTLPKLRALPSQIQKPALRRKRDATDMDLTEPSSPSKRARVAFSDNVEVNIVDEWEKAPELIREEVRRILQRHARADDNEDYDKLKAVFMRERNGEDAPSPTTLRNYTAALASNVSSLGRSQVELVRAIIKSDWVWLDEAYVHLFVRFLGNLVSAQGVWLGETLTMLVEKFAHSPRPRTPLRNQAFVSSPQVHNRAHAALRYILRLVPSAGTVLASIIDNLFPPYTDSRRRHNLFTRNLLRIMDYAPELQAGILALITERLIKIDVQVQVDLEDLAEEFEDGIVQEISKPGKDLDDDLDDEDSESEDGSDDEDDLDPEVLRVKEINGNVEKMDLLLNILFDYYTNDFEKHSRIMGPSATIGSSVASTLMSHFSAFILPTYRSRHTQFLLFHFMQASANLIDSFVGSCLQLIFDKTTSEITRQSAATYLASFVSRGIHVSASTARSVFSFLGSRLNQLRAEHEPNCRGPDPRRYHTFYAVAQALIYIFCFRWRDLTISKDDDEPYSLSPPGLPVAVDDDEPMAPVFMPGVKDVLIGLVFSRLNPLRVCAPSIVGEFAHITQRLHLLYAYSIIEANKRVRLVRSFGSSSGGDISVRETALTARKDEEWLCLDAYFPFDPYKLPLSKQWVEGDYREWHGVDGYDGTDSDSEEGSVDGEDDDDDDDESIGTGIDEKD